jgi:hypothetical protein
MIMPKKSDIVGVLSASLCIVHCFFTPLLLLMFAAFKWFHAISYIFLFISFVSAFEATKHSENLKILTLIWGSFVLFAIAILFEDDFAFLHTLSYVASFGLIIGHILNIRYCQKCK